MDSDSLVTLSPSYHLTMNMSTNCISPAIDGGYFAFALVNNDVCLVQVSVATPPSALTTIDVKIFRHEFITIFRFSESKTLHPREISIIEPIDDCLTKYEEENGTVFLARELMDRLRRMTERRIPPSLMCISRRQSQLSQCR